MFGGFFYSRLNELDAAAVIVETQCEMDLRKILALICTRKKRLIKFPKKKKLSKNK